MQITMMPLIQLLLFILVTFFSTSGKEEGQPCDSPQFIEFGKTGIIDCSFDENVFLLVWYNSTDVVNDEPLLYYRRPQKSGTGYATGEYDICSNGSLIVNQVSLKHDHYFTVVMTNSPSENIIPYTVRAVVTVKPNEVFPIIDKCGNASKFCFLQVSAGEDITCSIREVRPSIPLTWVKRTANGDMNVSFESTTSTEGIGFSTFASTINCTSQMKEITLLVCKFDSRLLWLSHRESVILVQSNHARNINRNHVLKFIELRSQLRLTCSKKNATFWIWKKRQANDSHTETPIAAFTVMNYTKINLSQDYHLDDEGSLVTFSTKIHHEGVYTCSYGNGLDFGSNAYKVIVHVPPSPPHPVVDGCEHQDPCILEKQYEDYLTCRLLGIRPAVKLEWNVFPTHLSSKITFSNEFREILPKGNAFDVTITSKYHVNDASQERLTIECKVSTTDETPFNLATNFDLYFLRGYHADIQTEQTPSYTISTSKYNHYGWIFLAVATLLIGVLLAGFKVVKARRRHRLTKDINEAELLQTFTIPGTCKLLSAKMKLFLSQLKGTYDEMYASVQPVPFIREMFSVNEVFVDNNIEFLQTVDGKFGKRNWARIGSYNDIFSDHRLSPVRYILEGGPGYGKSTFSLQLAYDWCNGVKYLKNLDVLILLKLRQMGKKVPIAKAIKHLLLPEDSSLTEDDVMDILRSCSSILFVLDGYDEYPDYETDDITDVKKIINRDIFQQSNVILTTRSSCLPKIYSSKTKRIRLTGFDEQSRDSYISKLVSRKNIIDCKGLKECLRENPVLSDLCQVPLFFAMFAHITHERKEIKRLTSVTSFFRYMVFCIHGHMMNKSRLDSKQHDTLGQNKIDHSKLNKEAFDSLNAHNRRDKWVKADLQEIIGQNCYNHFANRGILISERVMNIFDKRVSEFEHIQYVEEVRFYHKLFCEWYAAHYFSKLAAEYSPDDLNKLLEGYNLLELQYLLRFACGLNSKAAGNIIKYLTLINVPDQIKMLCIIEQTGDINSIMDSVRDVCSRAIEIRKGLSKIMLRSTIQLLEIAAFSNISISCLRFWNCFISGEDAIGEHHTDSGILRPNLKNITCIEIYESEKTLSEENVVDILNYVSGCMELKTLKFFDCLMPYSLIWNGATHFEVLWYTVGGEWYVFDVSSGNWKINGSYCEGNTGSDMTKVEYNQLVACYGMEVHPQVNSCLWCCRCWYQNESGKTVSLRDT